MVTITLTYSASPTNLQASFARYLYNKTVAVSLQLDDGIITGQDYQNAGVPPWPVTQAAVDFMANPSSPAMTDGCGNRVPYTLGFAVNGNLPLTDVMITSYLAAGHDLLDHSFGHAAGDATFITNDITQNRARWKASHNYDLRVGVGPSNYPGYVTEWAARGYLGATTQASEPGFIQWPNSGTEAISMEMLPAGFVHLGRSFYDLHAQDASTELGYAKGDMAKALTQRSATKHTLYLQGLHDPRVANFGALLAYVQQQAEDTAWVCGLHRLLEYREVIALTQVVSDTVAGNVRTIVLNADAIPATARYRDLTLLTSASGATLQSVSVSGATGTTYNTATGQINLFNLATAPAGIRLGRRLTTSTAGNNTITVTETPQFILAG